MLGRGGRIFTPSTLGEPVKIACLAEQMIRLAGKQPGRDIAIVYAGLRPGEKCSRAVSPWENYRNPPRQDLPARRRGVGWELLNTQIRPRRRRWQSYDEEALRRCVLLLPDFPLARWWRCRRRGVRTRARPDTEESPCRNVFARWCFPWRSRRTFSAGDQGRGQKCRARPPLIQYAVDEAVDIVRILVFVTNRYKRAIADYFDKAYELEQKLEQSGKRSCSLVQNVLPKNVRCVFVTQPEALGLGRAVLLRQSRLSATSHSA